MGSESRKVFCVLGPSRRWFSRPNTSWSQGWRVSLPVVLAVNVGHMVRTTLLSGYGTPSRPVEVDQSGVQLSVVSSRCRVYDPQFETVVVEDQHIATRSRNWRAKEVHVHFSVKESDITILNSLYEPCTVYGTPNVNTAPTPS